jgi:hypothetical protein
MRILLLISSGMGSSQAPYSAFEEFSHTASISEKYPQFLIDSLLLFRAGVDTPRIDQSREFQMYSLYGETGLLFITESLDFPYCLLRRVITLHIIYSRESLLTSGSFKHFEGFPPP